MADAFVVLPGGLGTFDEFFEVVHRGAAGRARKPIIVVNVDGYFDALEAMSARTSSTAGFARDMSSSSITWPRARRRR